MTQAESQTTGLFKDAERAVAGMDEPTRQRQRAVVRCVVRGRWDELREMNLHRHGADDSLCHYVFHNFLGNYIQSRVTSAGQEALLPAEWLEKLRAPQAAAQKYALRLRAGLVEAVSALRAGGVECRVLKGIPSAQRYYGDVDLRRMTDIDLLVRPADADRAVNVLWAIGYRGKLKRVKFTRRGVKLRRRMFRRRRYALIMSREGIGVDLHWQLRNEPKYRINHDAMWADAQQVCLDGMTYDVISDEYALVMMLLSIDHDIRRSRCRLRHMVDVYHLLHSRHGEFDWPKFFEHRAAEKILDVSASALMIVLDVLQCRDDFPALTRELERSAKITPAAGRDAGHLGWI